MWSKIVECVPNFSEGRRPEVIEAIVREIGRIDKVKVLDVASDPDHNRTVITFVGEPEKVLEAAFAGTAKATELIDLEKHKGGHPRIGATDCIPFVPLRDVKMEECVELARNLGRRIATELEIPVYLYAEAAIRPERRNLENIRRGEYEGLKVEISKPERQPDFGAARMHPTAGAVVIGARLPLIAFNINLGTRDVSIAKKIAKRIRASSGGLTNVKAMGLFLERKALSQVSINLTNYLETPLDLVFELVKTEAERFGVPIMGSEIIGLIPLDALISTAVSSLRAHDFNRLQIMEVRLQESGVI